jgi:hypothetical protein
MYPIYSASRAFLACHSFIYSGNWFLPPRAAICHSFLLLVFSFLSDSRRTCVGFSLLMTDVNEVRKRKSLTNEPKFRISIHFLQHFTLHILEILHSNVIRHLMNFLSFPHTVIDWIGVAVRSWTCGRKVLRSIPCQDHSCPDWSLSWYCSVPSGRFRDNTSIITRLIFPNAFNSSFIGHLNIRCYIVRALADSPTDQETGSSRALYSMRWFFSIYLILPAALGPGIHWASEMSTTYRKIVMFVGSEVWRVRRADNLTAICEPIV